MFNKDVIKEKKVLEKAKIELKMVTAELNEARKRLGAHEGMSLN